MATISFKMGDAAAQELRDQSEREGRSVTAIILAGLQQEGQDARTHADMARIMRENEELRRQLQNRNGRAPSTTKRISVPVSLEEYDALSVAAAKRRTGRGALIRDMLQQKKGGLPALEGPTAD